MNSPACQHFKGNHGISVSFFALVFAVFPGSWACPAPLQRRQKWRPKQALGWGRGLKTLTNRSDFILTGTQEFGNPYLLPVMSMYAVY